MSEPENFLTRWSRRKHDTERAVDEPDDEQGVAPAPGIDGDAPVDAAAKTVPAETKEPEFDISTLPPIESIDIGTDIRPFLQKGVPLHLSRAALRRAWTADPAIRDFIEVAENQWDFATGSDIPGFGPLEASDDVSRLVAEVFEGRLRVPVENLAKPDLGPSLPKAVQDTPESVDFGLGAQSSEPSEPKPQVLLTDAPEGDGIDALRRQEKIDAPQQCDQHSETDVPPRRSHGRALPQ